MDVCKLCEKEAFVCFKSDGGDSKVILCKECWADSTADAIKMILELDNCTKNENQSKLIVSSFLMLLNFFTDSLVEAKNASKS